MRSLLLDSGNSFLKWGLADDGEMRDAGRIARDTIRAKGIAVLGECVTGPLDAAIACNVAGRAFADELAAFVRSNFGCPLRFARAEARACGVTNAYPDPSRLGVDRWVALIGARAAVDSACVLVDAGTALTIDVLDEGGRHLGGQIVPGLRLMAGALAAQTSDLPETDKPEARDRTGLDVLAANTTDAIREGAVGAAAGAVERVYRAVCVPGRDTVVVVTGGDAAIIASALSVEARLSPNLVLEGLAVLLREEP